MRFLKSGKVKDVYEIDDVTLEFVFTDRISVFDKIIPSQVPNKGETLAKTSIYWFKMCAELGILTHYLGSTTPNRMKVKRVSVIREPENIHHDTTMYLIPLECITRYYLYGSLWDRVKGGEIEPIELGFDSTHNSRLGEPLPEPFFEVTTKLERVDRPLSWEEALSISGLTERELEELKELSLRIDKEMDLRIRPRGLIHVDGKKEFAFDEGRRLMVVDTFGTADEDRFWDAEELKKGRFVEKSKEFVRQYYRSIGYHDKLMEARRSSSNEPNIPPLPREKMEEVRRIYIQIYKNLTGDEYH